MGLIDDPTTRLLGAMLDAAALRAKVIAGNVANQNTPGYRRQVVRFEDSLREALRAGADAADLARIRPEVEEDALTPPRADGNNVSLELEMSAMRQNRLLYELYGSIQAGRLELLRAGIQGSR